MAVNELSNGNPDGTRLGQSTADLVAFYGGTPVAQQSTTDLATITVTIATLDSGWGFASSAGFNALVDQVQALRATLVAMNLVGDT